MPVWKYRTFEEAERALWVSPDDPTLHRRMNAVWSLGQPIYAVLPPPRGIRRCRTIEEANADQEAYIQQRVDVNGRFV
jgi:hypothetical protein